MLLIVQLAMAHYELAVRKRSRLIAILITAPIIATGIYPWVHPPCTGLPPYANIG